MSDIGTFCLAKITNADPIGRASASRYRINRSIARLFRCRQRRQIVVQQGGRWQRFLGATNVPLSVQAELLAPASALIVSIRAPMRAKSITNPQIFGV
jgi:hypothetical protein